VTLNKEIVMENQTDRKKVAQIVSWKANDLYTVEVVYRDGKTATLYCVTDVQWAAIKAEELEYELAEHNVETDVVRDIPKLPVKIENLKDVKQFLVHCREWIGVCFNPDMLFADYTKINSDDDEQAIDDIIADEYDWMMGQAFAVCKKFGVDLYEIALSCETVGVEKTRRETFIASCCKLDAVHLCAWCRSYVVRGYDGSEFILIALKDDEFEKTRKTGESHGICKQCKDGQIAAIRDIKAEKVTILESKFEVDEAKAKLKNMEKK